MKLIRQIFFLFIGIFINAQTSPNLIKGVVLNDKKEPIPNASVTLKDNAYQYIVRTNDDGFFSKKIYAVKNAVSIIIAAPNYAKIEKTIVPNNELHTFYLPYEYKEIATVEIKKGIIYKGDSTIYNADFYSNKKENKVIDLLKKLPNVDVTKEGKISINGKPVSKVLVEKETFFTGSSSLAINSLPANAVEKFEFIENYNENKILGGNDEKTILNISLKEDKKNLVFGDLLFQGDALKRYNVGANLFYYSPKTKLNLISNLNNINKSIFRIEDYLAFNGGAERLLRDPISFMTSIVTKDLLKLINPNEKFKNNQVFNAVHSSQKIWKDRFKISVFNINTIDLTNEIKENTLIFNDKRLSFFNRNEHIDINTNNKTNIFNLILNNENNEKIDFQYHLSLKNAATETEQNKLISLSEDTSVYQSINKNENTILNQSLDLSYKLAENHSQGWLVNMMAFNTNNEESDTADRKIFFHSIFRLNQNKNNILQNHFDRNNYFKINFQHKYNFLTHHQLGLNATFSNKKQNIRNYFFVNGVPIADLGSDMSINRNNMYLGIEYLFQNRFFTISLEGDFIHMNNDFKSDASSTKDRLQYILPKINFEYKTKKSGVFNLKYKRDLRDIPIHYYYLGTYLLSNTQAFTGSAMLENPITERFSFIYNKRSGRYGYNLNFKYDFYNDLKDYVNNTRFNSVEKTNTINYTDSAGEKHNFELRLEKEIFKNKISIISLNTISFDRVNLKLNGNDDISRLNSKNFRLGVKSRFKEGFNFEVYNQFNLMERINSLTQNRYRLNELGFSLNYNPTEKWVITADMSHNKDLVNNISFNKSSFTIDYHLNSSFYFNLFVNNILNSSRKIMLNNEEYFSYYQRENLMPRFFNLGLTYKL